MTSESDHERRRARGYHLGRLDEAAAEALEAEYFADRAVFDEVDRAADDLVDEYLEGQLDAEARAQIERRLGSPEWQERLRFARALRAHVRAAAGEEASVAPASARVLPFRRTPLWMFGAGLAAAAAIALAVTATLRTREELATTRAALDAARGDRERAEAQSRAAEAQAAAERTARDSLASQLNGLVATAVMLVPGTRADGATIVRIPLTASVVRLTAVQDDPLPRALAGIRFELRRGDTQVAGGAVPLSAVSATDGALEVQVPASALTTGEHELRIAIATRPGAFDDYARYVFTVRR